MSPSKQVQSLNYLDIFAINRAVQANDIASALYKSGDEGADEAGIEACRQFEGLKKMLPGINIKALCLGFGVLHTDDSATVIAPL